MVVLCGPSRREVERWWTALVRGGVSREEVHRWADPYVMADSPVEAQPLVMTALLHLHGFDLTRDPDDPRLIRHGGPGEHVHEFEYIRSTFDGWLDECREHDADPVAWSAAVRERVRRLVVQGD